MDATFDNDIQYMIAYFYDYYHDDERLIYKGLHPEDSQLKVPIEIKHITHSHNSESKDQVGYYIQFKTTQENPIDYYEEYVKKWDAEFPIGLYCDIPDEKGVYRKWLVTERADWLGLQFPTWYILPVDYVFQWVYKDSRGILHKYQMCGVQRSQNSYNVGTWRSYIFEEVENQRKCILPLNDISATIFYNQRFIISAPIPEPLAWRLTKVEDINPKGIRRLTFAQNKFDQHNDYIEKDEEGNVVGMYADYFNHHTEVVDSSDEIEQHMIEPDSTDPSSNPDNPNQDDEQHVITSIIKCSGKKQVKVGGSPKTLTVTFYEDDSEILDTINSSFSFSIDEEDVNDLVKVTSISENMIKINFLGDDDYLGKTLTVTNISNVNDIEVTSTLDIEIIPL